MELDKRVCPVVWKSLVLHLLVTSKVELFCLSSVLIINTEDKQAKKFNFRSHQEMKYNYYILKSSPLRTVPTIVTAHTLCTSCDTRVSYE